MEAKRQQFSKMPTLLNITKELSDVIKSGWLTTASRCARFEEDFARFVGARHALAVNSATAALHLGLEAMGIREGDKVLVPTFTFTAMGEGVGYIKAHPIFTSKLGACLC